MKRFKKWTFSRCDFCVLWKLAEIKRVNQQRSKIKKCWKLFKSTQNNVASYKNPIKGLSIISYGLIHPVLPSVIYLGFSGVKIPTQFQAAISSKFEIISHVFSPFLKLTQNFLSVGIQTWQIWFSFSELTVLKLCKSDFFWAAIFVIFLKIGRYWSC